LGSSGNNGRRSARIIGTSSPSPNVDIIVVVVVVFVAAEVWMERSLLLARSASWTCPHYEEDAPVSKCKRCTQPPNHFYEDGGRCKRLEVMGE